MSLNEQFIPGTWIDTIDVNDFVNLNKKPFLKEPIFLKKTRDTSINFFFQGVKNHFMSNEKKIALEYSSLENETFDWFFSKLESIKIESRVGYSENLIEMKEFYNIKSEPTRKQARKTTYQLFDEIATTEIKKMIKMNLFSQTPTSYSPFFFHPDVRIIALYGTKHLIKEKRWELKTLEKHLQTHNWMQRRILISREIETLKEFEKFAKRHKVDVTRAAENAEEALQMILITIIASMAENPSIAFSLSNVIPFIDIYLEYDIQKGILTEEKAQEMIDYFYLKLSFIQFILSPGLVEQFGSTPYFMGETFGGEYVTKTTYRFLDSLRNFQLYPFVVRVAWKEHLPENFKQFCEELLNEGIPVSFFEANTLEKLKDVSFFPYGQHGIPAETMMFHAGSCDVEKLFYLSLNGGKDVESNMNLTPITQPLRNKELDYEEVMSKFKEFLSYVLSSYVEMMNIVSYINEINQNHPFRTSLSNYLLHYQVQFGFHQVEKLICILSSIQHQNFELKRDKSGWVVKIESKETVQDEIIAAQLIELIYQEISKIPLYKNGEALVRIYYNEMDKLYSPVEMENKFVLPREISNVNFNANIFLSENEDVLAFVKKYFQNGFSELNISTNKQFILLDSIAFKKEED